MLQFLCESDRLGFWEYRGKYTCPITKRSQIAVKPRRTKSGFLVEYLIKVCDKGQWIPILVQYRISIRNVCFADVFSFINLDFGSSTELEDHVAVTGIFQCTL